MRSVTVQGETYSSTEELLDAIRDLERAREDTPEYGPQRRQLDAHLDKLRRAMLRLKEQEAEQEAKAEERRAASSTREGSRGAREQAQEERAREQRNQRARSTRKRQRQEFSRGVRSDVGGFADATGISGPAGDSKDYAMAVLGGTLMLVLGYMLVARKRGPQTVEAAAGGAQTFIRRVLDPTDPLVFRGAAQARARSSAGGGGQAAPLGHGLGRIIGVPYQGTHARAFNVRGGSDNWESENAVDIAAPVGTPVYAVTAGTIGSAFGSLGRGGRFSGLRLHLRGSGNEFYYAHLSRIAPGIRPGTRVQAGQLLGFTGSANGVAHLHFATQKGDPRHWVASLRSH